jgi:NAD(P)H dehydrogenase (quinone)
MPPKVLIVFYSRTGNIAHLAETIAAGSIDAGAEVRLVRVDDLAPESVIDANPAWKQSRAELQAKYPTAQLSDLEWADAIIFGSPTRYGNMAAELKLFIDTTGGLWVQGKLVNKVGSAFTSTASPHGGNESTLLTMLNPMMHHGMIIVTPGYADPAVFVAGTPYGASAVVGPNADQRPTEADDAVARFQGRRVAEVTRWLLAGRG